MASEAAVVPSSVLSGRVLRPRPTEVFHYTCSHARKAIGRKGHLVPLRSLVGEVAYRESDEFSRWMASRVWMTTLGSVVVPGRLGMVMSDYRCNRMEVRYRVAAEGLSSLVPWEVERMSWPAALVEAVEGSGGGLADVATWYVSTGAVPVVLDVPARSWADLR